MQTFQDLQTFVLSICDDLNGSYFTTAQISVFINNAQREVQKRLVEAGENYYEETQETTTVVNQQDYVYPSDFVKMLRCELVLSGTGINEVKRQLVDITLNQSDKVNSLQAAPPNSYVLRKDRFTVYPPPDEAYTLRLYYSYRVSDMVNTSDIADVPVDYTELIGLLACKPCFVKDDRAMTNLLAMIQPYEEQLKKSAENRDESASRCVIVTQDSGFGSLF